MSKSIQDYKPETPPSLPSIEEIEAAAEGLKAEVNKLVEVTKITEEIQEIKAREEERDRELKAALLSVVALLNRLHGWEPKPKKKSFSGGYVSPYSGGK